MVSRRSMRAHPRSRGENIRPRLVVWENVGSSPLTRGKLSGLLLGGFAVGLIPAHAGKTRAEIADLQTRAAHPRSRGENLTVRRDPPSRPGSSPLTRGKLLYDDDRQGMDGLIPAHAGKT